MVVDVIAAMACVANVTVANVMSVTVKAGATRVPWGAASVPWGSSAVPQGQVSTLFCEEIMMIVLDWLAALTKNEPR